MKLENISVAFTQDTLNEIIQKDGGIKCTSWSFGTGFKKGDSYLSETFRLSVQGVDEAGKEINVNLVIKALPKNAARRKLWHSHVFFRNEINFYTKVLPAFEKFQQEMGAKNPFNEYPRCYASFSNGINDFIALEDIGFLGYGTVSRAGTVDAEHFSLIMKALGRFHAVSLAFNHRKPKEFSTITKYVEETYYHEGNRDWYASFLKDAIFVAEDAITKEFGGSVYEEKSKEFLRNDVYSTQVNIVNRKNKYSVIQHGDCWMPNFLMRYNGETPIDIKILDFQLVRYASPAIDLSFFTYSCTDHKTRTKHFNEMLKVYHEAACALLKDLGSDPAEVFPYEALLDEMKEVGKFGCGMAIESLPLSMMDDEEVADLDEIEKEDAILTDVWKISPLKDQNSRLRLAECFKHAIDMGYIV